MIGTQLQLVRVNHEHVCLISKLLQNPFQQDFLGLGTVTGKGFYKSKWEMPSSAGVKHAKYESKVPSPLCAFCTMLLFLAAPSYLMCAETAFGNMHDSHQYNQWTLQSSPFFPTIELFGSPGLKGYVRSGL